MELSQEIKLEGMEDSGKYLSLSYILMRENKPFEAP